MSDLRLKVRGFTLYLDKEIDLIEDKDYTLFINVSLSKTEIEGESKTYVLKHVPGPYHFE